MNRTIVTLLISVLLTAGTFRLHPFYVSMTEIRLEPATRTLEVSVRVFTDDLEKALKQDCRCRVDLSTPASKEEMKPVLSNYLRKKLRLFPDGKPVELSFLGFEKEEESTWSFLEVRLPEVPQNLKVENLLLYEILKKQSNLVRYRKPGMDKTVQLQHPETTATF